VPVLPQSATTQQQNVVAVVWQCAHHEHVTAWDRRMAQMKCQATRQSSDLFVGHDLRLV